MSDTADPPRHPPEARGDPPRQARAVATRTAILTAAAEEFAARSYHEASLSRILERSKVTKGALYFHFVSKESIATAVVDEMEVICRAVLERAEAQGLDPLRTAARIAREMQDALEGPVLRAGQRLCAEGHAGPDRPGWPYSFWQDVFTDVFERAVATELLVPSVDPSSFARTIVDVSAGAFAVSLAVSDLTDLAQRVCENWELLLGAAAEPAWLRAWTADGGMRAVLGPHLVPGVAEGRGWVPGV
ncbi:ScbR family autoregulator-binding transcription factor [Actinomycetospora flava]|uniref:ScbR family autoregulator-binding transcription factor n=1 Tax=Actinomycetospora flava TaxID=3129232 RepID=A0ABU8M6Z3_9PSEU